MQIYFRYYFTAVHDKPFRGRQWKEPYQSCEDYIASQRYTVSIYLFTSLFGVSNVV